LESASTSALRLIVGLGNPGAEYEGTRHNIGFMVLDRLALRSGAAFAPAPRWKASVGTLGSAHLCKPHSFMNRSGQPARSIASFFKIPPAQTLVVFDDIALPLGRLRLRREGSAGGHNGMRSIIEHFGTDAVPRLRVGVGAPSKEGEAVAHVLGRFSSSESDAVDEAVNRAADAVTCVLEKGLDVAMNLYNQNPTTS